MQDSDFKRVSSVRQRVIHGCGFVALLAATVAGASTAPTISGTPATTIAAGKAYLFSPSASGPKGDTLTFSISNKPAWAGFNKVSGQLLGTPTAGNDGKYSNIVISVSDGAASASLPAFSITVSGSGDAVPTISGTPASSIVAGQYYAFSPKASGSPLTFSIANKPSWAGFNKVSGQLLGTPTTANVGQYKNIVISVSDGVASASLAAFAITVSSSSSTSGSTGSATLSWTAPTTNTNGSALTDLAGYDVYYGTSSSSMTHVVKIANPATTKYTVSSLAAGTWYFGVNAYTTGSEVSAMSNVGSKTIP